MLHGGRVSGRGNGHPAGSPRWPARAFRRKRFRFWRSRAPGIDELMEKTFGVGVAQAAVDVAGLGTAGPLMVRLWRPCRATITVWGASGVAATMRRAGFQAHDGFIFETLTARGGVLVGVVGGTSRRRRTGPAACLRWRQRGHRRLGRAGLTGGRALRTRAAAGGGSTRPGVSGCQVAHLPQVGQNEVRRHTLEPGSRARSDSVSTVAHSIHSPLPVGVAVLPRHDRPARSG